MSAACARLWYLLVCESAVLTWGLNVLSSGVKLQENKKSIKCIILFYLRFKMQVHAGKEMTFSSHSISFYHLSLRKWLESGVKEVRGKEKDNLERYTALSQSLLVTCANGVRY